MWHSHFIHYVNDCNSLDVVINNTCPDCWQTVAFLPFTFLLPSFTPYRDIFIGFVYVTFLPVTTETPDKQYATGSCNRFLMLLVDGVTECSLRSQWQNDWFYVILPMSLTVYTINKIWFIYLFFVKLGFGLLIRQNKQFAVWLLIIIFTYLCFATANNLRKTHA